MARVSSPYTCISISFVLLQSLRFSRAAWVELPDPDPFEYKVGSAVACTQSAVYVTGGSLASELDPLQQVARLPLGADGYSAVWGTAAPLINDRRYHVAVAIGDSIWAVGGEFGPVDSPALREPTELYRESLGAWVRVPSADLVNDTSPLPDGCSRAGGAAIGTTLYVAGGIMQDSGGFGRFLVTSRMLALETTDPKPTWRGVAPLPEPRASGGMVALGGKLYFVGGKADDGDNTPSSSLFIYDPAADAWSVGPNMTVPRSGLVVAAAYGRVWALGGACCWEALVDSWERSRPLSTVEVYDPSTGTWQVGPTLPVPAFMAAGCGTDPTGATGPLVIMGGVSDSQAAAAVGAADDDVLPAQAGFALDNRPAPSSTPSPTVLPSPSPAATSSGPTGSGSGTDQALAQALTRDAATANAAAGAMGAAVAMGLAFAGCGFVAMRRRRMLPPPHSQSQYGAKGSDRVPDWLARSFNAPTSATGGSSSPASAGTSSSAAGAGGVGPSAVVVWPPAALAPATLRELAAADPSQPHQHALQTMSLNGGSGSGSGTGSGSAMEVAPAVPHSRAEAVRRLQTSPSPSQAQAQVQAQVPRA